MSNNKTCDTCKYEGDDPMSFPCSICYTVDGWRPKPEPEQKPVELTEKEKELQKELVKIEKEKESLMAELYQIKHDSKYDDMAMELESVIRALTNHGFSDDQAFQLVLAAAKNTFK